MNIPVTTLKDATKMPSELDVTKMYTSDTLDVVHLHLLPNEQIASHVNTIPVIFCILEGTGQLVVNGTTNELQKFDVAEVPAGAERGLRNAGTADLRVLVLKKHA